ncbi:hypothetical protein [Sulfurimonas sp.]|uniref:hypothetical protein n=1 Tax=Sulfurimonas sp. TaxID=2022749 RepID=UPI002B494EB3|nr:hypothetical protein [Sulfurimonas sp.]
MKLILIILINVNIIFAFDKIYEIKHGVKEVIVNLKSVRGIEFIDRENNNGNGMYLQNNRETFYLQRPISLKKYHIGYLSRTKIVNGKKVTKKGNIKYYEIRLSCLKSNHVYFNCTEH